MSNLDAIRQKLKELGNKEKGGFKTWKPKKEHNIRTLPLGNEEELSFQVSWHYGVDGGRPMACPGTWGFDCIFCDFARALKSFKDENGRDKPKAKKDADWEFFKKIDAGVKHYIPMVERKADGTLDGPFLWGVTPATMRKVMKVCLDDDFNAEHKGGGGYKILTSLEQGLDLVVTLVKAGEGANTTSYDVTEVEPRKRFTPLVKDSDGGLKTAQEIVSRIPTEADITKQVTTADAEKVFAKYRGTVAGEVPVTNDPGVEYADNHGTEKPAVGGATVDEVVAKLERLSK